MTDLTPYREALSGDRVHDGQIGHTADATAYLRRDASVVQTKRSVYVEAAHAMSARERVLDRYRDHERVAVTFGDGMIMRILSLLLPPVPAADWRLIASCHYACQPCSTIMGSYVLASGSSFTRVRSSGFGLDSRAVAFGRSPSTKRSSTGTAGLDCYINLR